MTTSPSTQCWNVNRRESAISFKVRNAQVKPDTFIPSGFTAVSEISDGSEINEVSDVNKISTADKVGNVNEFYTMEEDEHDEITEALEDENAVLKPQLDHRNYITLRLTNQMHVLLISDPESSKCAASLCVKAGSRNDPKHLPGLAHFCENLIISKQSVEDDNEESFEKLVTSNGGQIHSRTRRDSTVFSFDIYPESFSTALRKFARFFLAHCFTEEDMEQSISSINQEFEKVQVLDEERRNRIDAALCKINHPYHKFDFGNTLSLWTRPKSTSSKLRDQVMKFIQENYSANLMYLVVLGTEELSLLQSQVETYFTLLQNSGTVLTSWSTSPYGEEHVKTRIDIVPITNMHQLMFIFPMPDYSNKYKSGVIPYMQFIVGNEGPGSLISLLREQNWAENLVPEYKRPAKGFAIFTIDVRLTHSGLKNIYNIVHNVFQYFKLLRVKGPQRWLWEEVRIMESARFEFQEQQPPLNYVENVATSMSEYPEHHCVAGKYLIKDYVPNLLRDFSDHLVPNDLRLILSTKSNLKEANKTEEWFGIHYRYTKIDRAHLKKWSNCELHDDLHLPKPSRFVPDSFLLKPRDLKPKRDVPRVITEDSISQVWFLQDHEFATPTAIITLVILSPLPRLEATHFNSIRFIEKILNDSLTETASNARHAGLYHKIEATLTGLTITVHGYDNKLHLYFNTILGCLFQFCSTGKVSIRFQDIKEACRENLNNWRNEEPYIHAMEYVRELLNSHTWNPEQLLLALNEDLDPNKLMYFCQEFLHKIKLLWFLHGNISESEAHRIYQSGVKYFDNVGAEPVKDPNQLTIQEAILPFNSYTVYHAQHPAHVESSCVTYLQTGCGEIRETILTELIAIMLRKPAVDMLRTADQLVWTEVRKSKANVGFEIISQEERDPSEIETSIEEFLTKVEDNLASISAEEFNHVKRELKLRKLEKTRSFKHLSRFLFEEILRETYNFQRNAKELFELEMITLEHLLQFYKNRIAPNGPERKRITVLVASSIEKENVILLQNTSAEAIEIPGPSLAKAKSLNDTLHPTENELTHRLDIPKPNQISSAIITSTKTIENNLTNKVFESIVKTLSTFPAHMTPTVDTTKQKKPADAKLPDAKHSQHHQQSRLVSSSNRFTSKTNQRPKATGSLANSPSLSINPYRKRTLDQKLQITSKFKNSKDPLSTLSGRYSFYDQGLGHNRNKTNISKHNIAIRKNSVVARPATSGVSGAPFFTADQQKSDNWRRVINKERFHYSRNFRQESVNDLASGSKSRNRISRSNSKHFVIPREDLDFRDYDFDFDKEIRRLKNLKKYLEYDVELKRYKSKPSKATSEDDQQHQEAPAKPHVPPDFSLQYEIRRLKALREILDEEASAEKETPATIIPYSHPVRKKKPPSAKQDNSLACTVHDVEKEIRRLINIKKYFDGETPSLNLHSVEYTVFVITEIKLDNEENIRSIMQSKLAQQTQARVSTKNPHPSPIQLTRNQSLPIAKPLTQEISQKQALSQKINSKTSLVTSTAASVEPISRSLKISEDIRKLKQTDDPNPVLKKFIGQVYAPSERMPEYNHPNSINALHSRIQKAKSLNPLPLETPAAIQRSTLPFMHFSLSYGPNQTVSEVTRPEKHPAGGVATQPAPYGLLSHTYPTRFQSNNIPNWTLPKKTENILRLMDIRLGNYTPIRKSFKIMEMERKVNSFRRKNSKRNMIHANNLVKYSVHHMVARNLSKFEGLGKKRSFKSIGSNKSARNENTDKQKKTSKSLDSGSLRKSEVLSKQRRSQEKFRLKKSDEKVHFRKSDEKVQLRKSAEIFKQRRSLEKVQPRKSTEKVQYRKSAEKFKQRQSLEKVQPRKSTEKVQYRKSAEKFKQRQSLEKVQPRKSTEKVQRWKSVEKVHQRKSLDKVRLKQSDDKVKRIKSLDKVRSKQSDEKVKPITPAAKVPPKKSEERVKIRTSVEKVPPRTSLEKAPLRTPLERVAIRTSLEKVPLRTPLEKVPLRTPLEKVPTEVSEEKVKLATKSQKISSKITQEKDKLKTSLEKISAKNPEEKDTLKKTSIEKEKVPTKITEEKVEPRKTVVPLQKSEEKKSENVRLGKSEEAVRFKKSVDKANNKKPVEEVARIKLEGRNSKINLKKMESPSSNKTRSASENKSKKSTLPAKKTSSKQLIANTGPPMKVPFEEKVTSEPSDDAKIQEVEINFNPLKAVKSNMITSSAPDDIEIFPEAPTPNLIEIPALVVAKMSIPKVMESPNEYVPAIHISEVAIKLQDVISESVVPNEFPEQVQVHFTEVIPPLVTDNEPTVVFEDHASQNHPGNVFERENPSDAGLHALEPPIEKSEFEVNQQQENSSLELAALIHADDSNHQNKTLSEVSEQEAAASASASAQPCIVATSSETRSLQGRTRSKRKASGECHSPDLRKWMRQVVVKEMQQCIKSLANKSVKKLAKSSNISSYASNVSLLPVLYHPPTTMSTLSTKANSAMHLSMFSTSRRMSQSSSHTQPLSQINKMQRKSSTFVNQRSDRPHPPGTSGMGGIARRHS